MLTSILVAAATVPFAQAWSDTALISRDDDWSGVAGVVGYRGDGLTSSPGADPRLVVADGSGTPADVDANESDPGAVGLAAGVTEFELSDPVVALQGSATAAAPHLVVSLDTRTRSGVSVRYRLRDIDPSPIANAVQPVALQYRVGVTGDFASVPGGFVGDATTGPGAASLVTPVSAALPADADDKPLVQLRILTTNAVGQDEWVGVDDIEVEANGGVCAAPGPQPAEPRPAQPPPSTEPPPPRPPDAPLSLTDLRLTPHAFRAATSGPAVRSTGRAGASLGFRVSRPATVQFRVTSLRAPGVRPRIPSGAMRRLGKHLGRIQPVHRENGRFSVRGRRGVNQLRFSGRLRGRALSAGAYFLTAQATDRSGVASAPATVDFRIRR